MLDIAIKNMWQRKTRTALTVVSIAVCIMLFITLSTATTYMGKSYDTLAESFSSQMYVRSPSTMSSASAEFPPLSSSVPMDKAYAIMNMSGLDKSKSTPLIIVALAPSLFQGGPPQVMAVGVPEGNEKAFYGTAKVQEGSGALSDKDQVILGADAATYYKVSLGDTLPLMGTNFTVAGILERNGNIVTNGMVMMPMSSAQEVFSRPAATTVLISPANGDFDSLGNAIKAQFPGLEVMAPGDMQKSLNTMMGTTKTFMGMITLVMLLVAGIVTLMVMVMSVSERTKEIGMMRAIGARRSSVLLMIVEESIVVCLAGSVLGIALSVLLIRIMFGGFLASAGIIAEAVVFMTIIGVLAAMYPAYRASNVQPLEALRYE
ncbi:putative ABC transporter [Methanocella paludicola SANAE]|uniref:ABC transporter n=1 Tax=Methanocella paludicola (strain DSM 17711 / JCM 13418 / NBRC 101707 / SANAE) TaxID=304371 RepID=D1Z133_METPS|nr:FtsX-like permease family protein [Methanocella paludicola]BAI62405.1 putative ABC transporter [Methanocella paludicola SANAE]